jgi:4'-phosphopantetheinyl transferase
MWSPPPKQLLLEQGHLHVWRVSLSLPAAAQERCESLLSPEEKEQCRRYTRSVDRVRSAAARGCLRIVLAKYLDKDPRALSILAGANGKPFLDCHPDAGMQFNVSHADDRALIAVSRGARVGIDIEPIRDVRNLELIADDFFSEQEKAFIRSREGPQRVRAFFWLWTRREAGAKAMGLDLFDFFARFSLPAFDRNESGRRVVLTAHDSGEPEVWWIRDLSPARGFAASLCVERENPEPSFWNLLIR